MSTVSARAPVGDASTVPASSSAERAPSAVTQGMDAVQLPGDGLEHGAWSVGVRSLRLATSAVASSAPGEVTIDAIDSPCADGAPAMDDMPGVVHTDPPITIVR